jgi:exosortase/archaeosortase family protein
MLVLLGILTGLLYLPLLYWLGWTTLHTQQLVNGALLVLMALALCIREAVGKLRLQPQFSNFGIVLLALGFFYLWMGGRSRYWALPLVLLSFCFSFAGIMSFLFGRTGVRPFLPALGAFFVFGVLVGLFPTLDWPLREMAGRYAGRLLASMNVPVQLVLAAGQPAKLLLEANGHFFEVATECNGFGLLTSSLIVATVLALLYEMPASSKLGLVALAVPIAIVFNFLRIVSICLAAPRTRLPYGFVHETLGLIFYFLALGLIWKIAGWHTTGKHVPPQPEGNGRETQSTEPKPLAQ